MTTETKFHYCADIPSKYGWGAPEELDTYDKKYVVEAGIEECWYWYMNGGYEGDGAMLCRIGEEWWVAELGHCSCYGPTEDVGKPRETYESPSQIFITVSKDLQERLKPLLVLMAKEYIDGQR